MRRNHVLTREMLRDRWGGVYDTASAIIAGPTLGKAIWSSFPANDPCPAYNDGDPIVHWDKRNQRWIMTRSQLDYVYVRLDRTDRNDARRS